MKKIIQKNNSVQNKLLMQALFMHRSNKLDQAKEIYNKILIIEDDNLIHHNIQHLFDSFTIPNFNDLIYFGYIPLNDDMTMWTYEITYQSHNAIDTNFFKCRNLWGLFAYGITKELIILMY